MNLRTLIATATTAAVLGTGGVALAGAAAGSGGSATSSSTPAVAAVAPAVTVSAGRVPARLRRRIRRGIAAVLVKTIGVDVKTLRTDLLDGQTIAQIATAKGVQPQTVVSALVTAADKALNDAVQHNLITQARATKIEQKIPARATAFVNNWHPKRGTTTTSA